MIPAGSRLHGLTASLPASAAAPAVVTLTDPSGRMRAVWTIAPGTDGIVWSDLAGFPVDDTWTETVTATPSSTTTSSSSTSASDGAAGVHVGAGSTTPTASTSTSDPTQTFTYTLRYS